MAHESFEDPETAELMNDRFVNVKVDREERPDVDAVYMQAVQAMTGRGGWPMSVWLTPDGRPFHGGTYYPDRERHGMPSFRQVLRAVDEAWRERRPDVLGVADRLTAAIADDGVGGAAAHGEAPAGRWRAVADAAVDRLLAQFEPRAGGFGRAPKFPPAMVLTFLCRVLVRRPDPEVLTVVTTTLDGMARGGLHDQVGGGFARYSVDDRWLVPHFEKMLYDNALLLRAYLSAALLTGEPRWRHVVERTVGYLLDDLRHPDGGFFSARDADSEGVEGRYYVWSLDEIREVCGDDAEALVAWYGVTHEGNFEGANILAVAGPDLVPTPAVERARQRLLERRRTRVPPGLDDKVLLAWNALVAGSLAEAGAAFERDDWLDAARANVGFLLRELRRDDGRLLRSWQADADERPGSGRARHLAYADDHGALLETLATMAEVDDSRWLVDARDVADDLVRLFHDPDRGDFYTTGSDAEALVVRPRDVQDNATPSGSSLAANGLLRLAALTGAEQHRAVAERVLSLLAGPAAAYPTAFGHLLGAYERAAALPLEVAVVGPSADPRTAALRREVFGRLLPPAVVLTAEPGDAPDASPLLVGRTDVGDGVRAYVCEGFACGLPASEPAALRQQLDEAIARQRAAQ
jgi:uncharacterized protein YyaL (SSP411 family)